MQPVLRPDLPTVEELTPYLRRIEESGIASNDGPLVRELEARLGGVAVSSATLGLEIAITHVFRKGRVRVPAFTFPATVTAIIRAGCEPVFCDTANGLWEVGEIDDRTLAVAPFGYWQYGREAPLIDAAGVEHVIRDLFRKNPPMVRSLHATKPVIAGEGGMVTSDDEDLRAYVREQRDFGRRNGVVVEAGTNAKMSEYHAAVALACLDRSGQSVDELRRVARRYEANLGEENMPPWCGQTVYPVIIDNPHAVMQTLADIGYESRRWYTPTCEQHPAFRQYDREPLPNTRWLADRLLCLPFHRWMTDEDVDRVSEVVLCASSSRAA